MLQRLNIKNYAIIDQLSLEPDSGLNTLTGETGAGKSIILGALSLILGERADTSVLIHKDEKCVVEATFEVSRNPHFRQLLQQEDLDDEDTQCIIRREIAASGKSRAFINDTPVNLTVLHKLTSQLVDLHQQFDHLELQNQLFQINVLDAVGGNADLRKIYEQLYHRYRLVSQELNEKKDRQQQWQKEADYKQYLLDELAEAHFSENEVEDAAAQLKTISHAEHIHQVLQGNYYVLEEGEQPVNNELRKIVQQLQAITEYLPEAAELAARLQSAHAELKDIAGELDRLQGKVNLDPGLMERLQERVDLGYRLFKKHGVADTAELLALQARLDSELQQSLNLNETIEQLEKEAAHVLAEVKKTGAALSERRAGAAREMAGNVNKLLHLVGMPNALFSVELQRQEKPEPAGLDRIQFMLDANKSGRSLPLYKAASGGEMSRIMLCIKSLTAQAMELPTLIFDEVDTGISGEAARQVGNLLRDLSRYHQVIVITHQPQVAARGARHFFVYKDSDGKQKITTRVRVLQPEERVLAIARMIGGEQPGAAALQHARELVAN